MKYAESLNAETAHKTIHTHFQLDDSLYECDVKIFQIKAISKYPMNDIVVFFYIEKTI